MDNGLFIAQYKSISISNVNLFCSYNIISFLFIRFRLVVEHSKTGVFHFSRLHSIFNPLPLDLTALGSPILLPKTIWQYLGFFFNQKLTFCHHIDSYTNKAIFTIKCMKILGNSSRDLILLQKRWLYICCVLPIALYDFQLWYYNKAPLNYPLRILRKMQRRAVL